MNSPALRAPKEHGAILAVPPLDQVGALLEKNRRLLQVLNVERSLARQEILDASTKYHQEAGQACADVIPISANPYWLVAGHQPELFHPGVWYKNFVLHRLAQQHGGVAVNLIVDTDTAKPAFLHLPSNGKLARVRYDRSTLETPYEERPVEDEQEFTYFPQQLEPWIAGWDFKPMLESFWREVMQHAKRTPLLGERFASARRALERRWGMAQRELPISRVCQTASFARFAGSIFSQLPRFHDIHNRIVHSYRQEHDIHSKNHPVPDLATDGDWLEAPLWAWRPAQARRARLFVRRVGDTYQLRANAEAWPTIPADPDRLVDAFRGLESRGFKIRSRALTTTMFARLYLADLFLHGIGGGIYDELTDRLITEFMGISAPAYLVISATLLLPLPRFPEAERELQALERKRRDLVYKPELFISAIGETSSMLEAKRHWIAASQVTHAERVERFHQLRQINEILHPLVQSQSNDIERAISEARARLATNDVNMRRDYAFCLYPEDMLQSFFTK